MVSLLVISFHAPTGPYGGFPGSPVWQAAYPVIVRNAYRHYGNLRLVREHYEGVVELIQYWQVRLCVTHHHSNERSRNPLTSLIMGTRVHATYRRLHLTQALPPPPLQ